MRVHSFVCGATDTDIQIGLTILLDQHVISEENVVSVSITPVENDQNFSGSQVLVYVVARNPKTLASLIQGDLETLEADPAPRHQV